MNSPAFVFLFLFLFPILSASFRCCVCCLQCLQETCSTLLCENCRSCRTCRAAFRRACVSFISRKKYTDKYPDSIKLLQAGLSVIQTKTPGYPKKFQIFSQRRRMHRGGNISPFCLHCYRKEAGNIWLIRKIEALFSSSRFSRPVAALFFSLFSALFTFQLVQCQAESGQEFPQKYIDLGEMHVFYRATQSLFRLKEFQISGPAFLQAFDKG